MNNAVLGHVPALSRVVLIDGQDFAHTVETNQTLPVGTVVSLEFLNTARDYSYGVYPVVNLAVRIDAGDHDHIPNGSWFRLWAAYPSDGGRFCWLAGPVERNHR